MMQGPLEIPRGRRTHGNSMLLRMQNHAHLMHRSTPMYLADRTSVECKPHVAVYTDGSTKLKEPTMAWSVILKTDCALRPATYAVGRVRKLGSTPSMLAELVAIANALVKVAANVDDIVQRFESIN
jgi:hypothetical protein